MNRAMNAHITRLACVVGIVGPLCGCASFGGTRTTDPLRDLPPRPRQPADTEPAEMTQATLAAVEEFLERTSEYQASDVQSPPPPQPIPMGATGLPGTPARAGDADLRAAVSVRTEQARDEAFANTQVALHDAPPSAPALALPVLQTVSIRSAVSKPDAVATEPARSNTTNEPLDAQPAGAPMVPERLVSYLEHRADESGDFESEWQLRLAQLALRRDAEALKISAHLPQETRSMLAGLIHVALAIRSATRDPLLSGAELLNRIDELRQTAADRADPVVATIALCRKVVTFGVYDEMVAEDFLAGRSTQTIVYSEIRNFRSELTDDGQYQTRLATRLEVLTAGGQSVWQREEPEIVDRCRGRRTDFFIAQRITLPSTLPAGDYVLKVWVEDGLSGKASEAAHPFVVKAPLSVVSSGQRG